jgi:putative sigma-54 modulation protein
MTINLRALGLELTPAIHQYVEEKFATLEKYIGKIMQIDVVVSKDTNHHHKGDIYSCSVNIDLPKDLLKVERTAEDLYKAIDAVKDHLRETLSQYKDREMESHRTTDGVE